MRVLALSMVTRGQIRRRPCCVLLSNLPRVIAEREWQGLAVSLNWPDDGLDVLELPRNHGPGPVRMLELESDSLMELCTPCGDKQASWEQVAHEPVTLDRESLQSGAPVGEHLADQLLLPLTLAGRGAIVATRLTPHTTMNIDVIRQFRDIHFTMFRAANQEIVSVDAQRRTQDRASCTPKNAARRMTLERTIWEQASAPGFGE